MNSHPPLTIDQLCKAAFGCVPDAIETPGGKDRKTVIICIGDKRFAVSERRSKARAKMEALVLRNLGSTGLVPRLIYARDAFVVQEFIDGERLSATLDKATPDFARFLICEAAKGLAELQRLALANGMLEQVPKIGERQGWIDDLMDMPSHLAKRFDLAAPVFDRDSVRRHLQVPEPHFVKWDARPGNAIVTSRGKVVWMDWEHCGRRQAHDDLVWLLADEWCPDFNGIENELRNLFPNQSAEGFAIMATLHSCVRLDLIVSRKGDGPWWDHIDCRDADKIGVTQMHAQRVISKAARWAAHQDATATLAPFFKQISRALAAN